MSSVTPDKCVRARQQISLRLDLELSELEGVLLEAHLAKCDECRAFAAEAGALTGALRAAPPEEPAISFRLPHRPGGWTYAFRAVSGAAVVAVIALTGLISLHVSPERTPGYDLRATRELTTLKERQLDQLGAVVRKSAVRTPAGVAAAERVTLDGGPDWAATPSRSTGVRFPEGVFSTSEGR